MCSSDLLWTACSAMEAMSDEEIDRMFLAAQLPQRSISSLSSLLAKCNSPLAVRSSSVLEDHVANPFAGVFRTFLLPNSHPEARVRLGQLIQAIKLVYSSMFLKNARAYRESLNIPAREEKMAVIIQKMAGSQHGFILHLWQQAAYAYGRDHISSDAFLHIRRYPLY